MGILESWGDRLPSLSRKEWGHAAPDTTMTQRKDKVDRVQDERRTRRKLPHLQVSGSVYFLTWRTKGMILSAEDRDDVLAAILFWDGKRWEVFAAVVMPDHVHAIVRPFVDEAGAQNLSSLLSSVKGYSARSVNRRRGSKGPFWQDETHDRIVRDKTDFF
jgi:putative transposase